MWSTLKDRIKLKAPRIALELNYAVWMQINVEVIFAFRLICI